MNEKREIKRLFIFDFRILLSIIFLMIAGGVAVYSSTYSAEASRMSWLFFEIFILFFYGLGYYVHNYVYKLYKISRA